MFRILLALSLMTVGLPDIGNMRVASDTTPAAAACCCCGTAEQCRCDCTGTKSPSGSAPVAPMAQFCGCGGGNDAFPMPAGSLVQKPQPTLDRDEAAGIGIIRSERHGIDLCSQHTGPPDDPGHLSTIILLM